MSLTSVCQLSELFVEISKHLEDERPLSVVFGKTGSCEKINYKVNHEWISFAAMETNQVLEMQLYLYSPPTKMIKNPRVEGLKVQMNRVLEDRVTKMTEMESFSEMYYFFICFLFPFISFSFIRFQLVEWSKKSSNIGSFLLCITLFLVFCYEAVYFTFVHPKRKSF